MLSHTNKRSRSRSASLAAVTIIHFVFYATRHCCEQVKCLLAKKVTYNPYVEKKNTHTQTKTYTREITELCVRIVNYARGCVKFRGAHKFPGKIWVDICTL